MISTSGAELLGKEAIAAVSKNILPLATVLTPNVPEAEKLLHELGRGRIEKSSSLQDLKELSMGLVGKELKGPKYVLLKGAHMPLVRNDGKKVIYNVLSGRDGSQRIFESPYLDSNNTHGTGCSLASRYCTFYSDLVKFRLCKGHVLLSSVQVH